MRGIPGAVGALAHVTGCFVNPRTASIAGINVEAFPQHDAQLRPNSGVEGPLPVAAVWPDLAELRRSRRSQIDPRRTAEPLVSLAYHSGDVTRISAAGAPRKWSVLRPSARQFHHHAP
jgi:hypothetical protein